MVRQYCRVELYIHVVVIDANRGDISPGRRSVASVHLICEGGVEQLNGHWQERSL